MRQLLKRKLSVFQLWSKRLLVAVAKACDGWLTRAPCMLLLPLLPVAHSLLPALLLSPPLLPVLVKANGAAWGGALLSSLLSALLLSVENAVANLKGGDDADDAVDAATAVRGGSPLLASVAAKLKAKGVPLAGAGAGVPAVSPLSSPLLAANENVKGFPELM